MGIDFNSFRSNFLNAMKNVANEVTKDGKIDNGVEIASAKHVQSAFKADLEKVTQPIGDAFVKTTKADDKKAENEVTLADLTALLDDPELNIDRVNQLIAEKPVSKATTEKLAGKNKVDENGKEMLALASKSDDVDASKLAFYSTMPADFASNTIGVISSFDNAKDANLAGMIQNSYDE